MCTKIVGRAPVGDHRLVLHRLRPWGWGRHLAGALTLSLVMLAAGCSAAGDGRAGGPKGDGTFPNPEPITDHAGAAALCRAIWQRNERPKHAFSEADSALSNEAIPSIPRPRKGVAQWDPVYGSCVLRLTDHRHEAPKQFARHDYSRRQAFNADSSRVLISAYDGTWHLYDADSLAWLKRLDGVAGDAELQWHPTDPRLVYFQAAYGIGMQIHELNVETGATREVADFSRRLKAIWPKANSAWTRSEGSPSIDGRYWCFMVDDAQWNSLGVFTWDMQTDSILGTMDTKGDRPDHVSMSPAGSRCVVSGDTPGVGTRAWTRDFKRFTELHHKSEHSDLAFDADGREVYVSIDYQSKHGDVFMTDIETGKRTVLFRTYLDGTATAMHFSGRAHRRPGWVLVSTYARDGRRLWLHEKIMAMSLEADPSIRGLGYHHVRFNGYWSEPQATVNPDFTRVLFNSNWGSGSELDIDSYMMVLPRDALQAKAKGVASKDEPK
ncbi:MAG: hypothetical protein Q4A16_09295 [Lautropia sp.]|nr:hypothetical protein [Lautropia sp.]